MREFMILLGATALISFAAGAMASERYNLIVNRHSHEGDYTHRLHTNVAGTEFDLPIKRQVFLRSNLKQCEQSAQAQLDSMTGYLIESWRCEKLSGK